MYYLLIILSTIMFAGTFVFQDNYRKIQGNSVYISVRYSLICSASGILPLFLLNRFSFECTPFSLIMAMLSVANGFGFTYCSFKALGRINVSMYSLYCMLGGMLLPFIQGIIFFDEKFTLAKIICLVFVTVSLLLSVNYRESGGGAIFYAGVFILNGMAGVLTKIFTSAPYPKTDAESYSILCAICSTVAYAVLFWVLSQKNKEAPRETLASVGFATASGIINRIANYILVVALLYVDSSVQYPLVTGGTIVVSTLIGFFKKQKPAIKEIFSVMLAFLGMLALFIIK